MVYITIFVAVVVVVLLIYLVVVIKKLEEKKLAEVVTKLELSSQSINDLKTTFFNSLSLLQNHINQTINQISTTDSTLRTQLELLRNAINEQISSTVKNLNLQIKTTTEATSKGFEIVSQQIDQRLQGTTEIFSQLAEMISKLNSSAEQLKENTQELQRSLGAVKFRGNFGEELLEKILLDVFPKEMVKFQYPIKPDSNERVDAAIIFKDKIFPIDSKFNMDLFLQLDEAEDETARKNAKTKLKTALKRQIDEIAQKYILPDYGAEYAFMYIPSEAGFNKIFELEIEEEKEKKEKADSIIRYARSKHVIICSPQTLLPYLHFVTIAVQTEHIARNIGYLRQQIQALANSLGKLQKDYSVLGQHLKNAYEKYTVVENDIKMLQMQTKSIISIESPESIPELPQKQ